MTLSENFNLKYLFYFILGMTIGFLIGFNTSCFAYSYGDSEDDFENVVNTMSEFTTLDSLLADTSYRDTEEYIRNFKTNYSCGNVYLISYYNSGVYSSKNYKSLDLFCVPSGVSMKPNINTDTGKLDYFYFRGERGQVITVRHNAYIRPSNVSITIDDYGNGLLNYSNSKFHIRSVFDITNYYDFSQPLPNFFMSQSFSHTGFLSNIFTSVNSFGFYIAFMVALFVFLYIINKKLGLGLGFEYKGGVKL